MSIITDKIENLNNLKSSGTLISNQVIPNPLQELHIGQDTGNADLRLQGEDPTTAGTLGSAYMDVYQGPNIAGMYYNGGGTNGVLRLGTNGDTSRWIMNGDGHITIPNHPVAYIKQLTAASGQDMYGGNAYVVRGGMSYNSSTGAVTVPVAGVYCISISAFTNQTGGKILLQLKKNGATSWNGSGINECMASAGSVGQYDTASQTIYLPLEASDTVSIFVNTWTSGIYSGGNGNALSIALLG